MRSGGGGGGEGGSRAVLFSLGWEWAVLCAHPEQCLDGDARSPDWHSQGSDWRRSGGGL